MGQDLSAGAGAEGRLALRTLSVQGFKSIRELQDFPLQSFNVLIGANGAGKSNFIDALQMVQACATGTLDQFVLRYGQIENLLYGGQEVTQRMRFEVRLATGKWGFSVVPRGQGGEGEVEGEGEERGDFEEWRVFHFHNTSAAAAMRGDCEVADGAKLRADAGNVAAVLLRLREEDAFFYGRIRDVCQLVAPYFDDFCFRPRRVGAKTVVALEWKSQWSDRVMQPCHWSDGTIRFVCLATALLQPRMPALVVIDEPELGLNPSALRILAELLQHAATQTQVVAATQSSLLVDQFWVEDIVAVNRRRGQSCFEWLRAEDYREWLEDYPTGDLWARNVIHAGTQYEYEYK